MNELLQKHGCSAVFSVPDGLKELMSDISREVLRDQPERIYDYITNYLSVLILTREHGILAVKLLDDLCDCRPTVSEHLLQLGLERDTADLLSDVIKQEVESFEPFEGRETVKEMQILKRILARVTLDEDMAERVCQVSRNAYRDYWYRKKLMEQALKVQPEEPWQIAAERTLDLYKKTRPSFTELNRATQKIQAAYRGYYVRKNLLRHLKLKPKKRGPKVDLPGPPIDIAESRTIDLGPIVTLHVKEDDVARIFEKQTTKKLGLQYDPMKTITHIVDEYQEESKDIKERTPSSRPGEMTRRVSIRGDEEYESAAKIPEKPKHSGSQSAQVSVHTTPHSSNHRISFAGVPSDFDMDVDDSDIPEEIIAQMVEIIPEVPDDDDEPSVPHELPASRSEGDGRSTPTSAASSTIGEDMELSRLDELDPIPDEEIPPSN